MADLLAPLADPALMQEGREHGPGWIEDAGAYLREHGIGIRSEGQRGPFYRWVLDACVWNGDHSDGAAFVLQFPNGAISAGCLHNSCAGKTWPDFRDAVEPGWRPPPRPITPPHPPLHPPPDAATPPLAHGGTPPRLTVPELGRDVLAHGEAFAVDVGGKLWVYADGVYVPRGEQVVARHVKALLSGPADAQWSTHKVSEVVAWLATDAPALWERPPLDRLNVQNGLLDVSTRTLAPHTPDFLSPVQLPVRYDAQAMCPAWERFIGEVFPSDAHALAWEVFAWLMLPSMNIQKAVLLLGEGGNGKSTFLRGLTAFIGRRNVANKALQRLEADRFAVAGLIGKLANICADLPSTGLVGTSVFKQITGGDAIPAEYKFRDGFDASPFARLIFSANTPPHSTDAGQAFYDRWLVIPFPFHFRGEAEEVAASVLDARLAEPGELSGVLNQALTALAGVRARNGFMVVESTVEALRDFQATTDPFAVWLATKTREDGEAVTPCQEVRNAYRAVCVANGYPPLTDAAFGRHMTTHRPGVEKMQRMVRGTLMWCYVGLAIE